MTDIRPPLPPFNLETAKQKVRMAENAWNSRNPEKVVLAYSKDSQWRNRDQFLNGHTAIKEFLTTKWEKELEYRLIKALWAFDNEKIAVRFVYEWRNHEHQWFRSLGNEMWAFDTDGLMCRREASINDCPISEQDRLFLWPLGARPEDHPGLENFDFTRS